MKMSYIKLNAQKKLMKNHFACFCASFLPYVFIVLLLFLNYYLYIFLKGVSFGFTPLISSYDVYIKASLFTMSIVISYCLWKIIQLNSQKYFFSQIMNTRIKLRPEQYLTAITVSLLRFYLSVSWSAFYLFPCGITCVALYYSIASGDYTFSVILTLFVASVILFIIGVSFIYVTLKRYSMCSFVIFTEADIEAISVIEKSISLIEGNGVRLAFYSLSFVGWVALCVLIIPAFYVLPYLKMSRYSFYRAITKTVDNKQKPVIFYLNKKVVGD